MLARYPFVRTRYLSAAQAAMHGSGVNSFHLKQDDSPFFLESNFVNFRHMGLIYVNCSVPGLMEMAPASFVRQYFPIAGSGRLTMDGANTEISPSTPGVVVPTGTSLRFEGGANYRHLSIRIEGASLEQKLSALLGEPLSSKLRFDGNAVARGRHSQSVRQAVFELVNDLDMLGDVPSLVMEELQQSILIRYLLFHHHNYTPQLSRAPLSPSRAQVQAAKNYIEANWNKPLDIEAVTQAAGISARSLFRHFKQSENCSPSDFAKAVRLEHARTMLQSADGSASVISVARTCGFRSFGHFARDFRSAYGQLPSDAIRKAGR